MITTKWPKLIVVGKPFKIEQADEILIRTNGWHWISTNDRAWESTIRRVIAEATARPVAPSHELEGEQWAEAHRAYLGADSAWRERMGILELHYLNNSWVASSYVGGPHGWCDWDGRIGCTSYNIGKWPDDEDVTEDWTAIAAAFPFLDLTAQCIDEEGTGRLAAEWRVRDGRVEYIPEPSALIAQPTELTDPELLLAVVGGTRSERGVSEERLRSALERVAISGGTP